MKLISLEINEPHAGWCLKEASFFSDVTLLVGLSGVGKTRILESIRKLAAISKGKSAPQYFGIDWKVEFEHDEQRFVWTGQFERTDLFFNFTKSPVAPSWKSIAVSSANFLA